jgi:hypothetical protein
VRFKTAVLAAPIAALVVTSAAIGETRTAPPVASLRTLPAPAKLPAQYVRLVKYQAIRVGVTRSVAVARTRILLTNVTGLPLYAFAGTQDRVCFAVWPGGGGCGTLDVANKIIWLINTRSRNREAVVGVVSDGVRAVDVQLGGRLVRATVRHNAFVVPFRRRKGDRMPQPSVVPVIR